MKNVFYILFGILIAVNYTLNAQSGKRYETNWESLNSAPVPAWFNEAKIALYVFWGPYSVPAYDPGYGYAEWYGGWDRSKEFHERVYGKDFLYEDFADQWKAELWNPDDWADLFSKSGAKYFIVVAKYHDGFCLFPTSYDARTINRDKWNSIDRGPKRDIIGNLFDACKKRDLKMGLYMSVYEWWHPLWVNPETRGKYVDEVFHPQFKELITRYKPWFVFTDGAWAATDKIFKSEKLVSWLLNDSPVKDYVAFNDRWGMDSKGKNGMIYNTEFGGGAGKISHAWQEDRSFGPSYGYNRNLKITDYDTPEELIGMIVQCVARGGNIILGVGPKADGTIPEIYQERILQMGDWLKVNGEAIYGTTKWQKTEQIRKVNVSRLDSTINFNWKLKAPVPMIPKRLYDVIWDGSLVPDKTDEYKFKLSAIGQSRFFLNDSLLIDRTGTGFDWLKNSDSVSIHLDKNKSYKVSVEYYRNQNRYDMMAGEVRLLWSRRGLTPQPVPASRFYSDYKSKIHGLNAKFSADLPEVFYTKKGNSLYAICPIWPGEELILNGVVPSKTANISILGIGKNLKWSVNNNNLHIKVPQLTIDKLPCQYAWTFKIENFD
ncbi:MAG: alpha-L-fucosidase [Prolixibacteraceae bacterium]|jgi:alpha-L-fucosidase|nr:alpha-L-fucosidase [Prolixibacteraceae bacterium]